MSHFMINDSHIKIIKDSGFFDSDWYLREYPDVGISGLDPITHYFKYGASLGRNPGPDFDGSFYLSNNPDIQAAGVNPLLHYIQFGQKENREIKPSSVLTNSVSAFNDASGVYSEFDFAKESVFLEEMADRYTALSSSSLPLVSIVMPTWNRADHIEQAIESVLAQNYAKFEILVCDDGSRDDTTRIVSSMAKKDRRIRYFPLNHQGVSAARNHGLANAEGGLVAYLDSDNAWRPSFLSTMVTYVMTEKLDCAYSGMRISGLKFRGQTFDRDALLSRNYIDLNTFVHRRSLSINRGGFDESLRRMVDWDLISRYTKDSATEYAPFVGVEYDDTWGHDRITSTESGAWEHIVRSKLLIDWNAIKTGLSLRQSSRLSIVVPIDGHSSTGALVQAIENWDSEIGARISDLEFVFVRSANDPLARPLLETRRPSNIVWVDVPVRANLAFRYNSGFAASSGMVVALTQQDFAPATTWTEALAQLLTHRSNASLLYALRPGAEFNDEQVLHSGLVANARRSLTGGDKHGLVALTATDYESLHGMDAGCADNLVFSELIERADGAGRESIALETILPSAEDGARLMTRESDNDDTTIDQQIFVDPFDDRVRRQVRALAEGNAGDVKASQTPGLTGVWHFTGPYTVSGWCMDLNNPGVPVSVSLTSDEQLVATATANQKVIARETGLSLVLPVGFRFDLSDIDGMTGNRLLNVEPQKGGRLLPGQARIVQLPEEAAAPELLGRIDTLVTDGDLTSAYLIARKVVGGGAYGAAERFLVLDFLLRQNWHCYPDFLDSFDGRVRPQLMGAIQYFYEITVLGAAYTNSVAPPVSGLPDEYIKRLSEYSNAQAFTLQQQLERVALWNILDAVPKDSAPQADYAGIEVVLAYSEEIEPSVITMQWRALAERGCRVVRSDASSYASQAARWQLRLVQPRYLGIEALGYLAGVLDTGVGLRHAAAILDLNDVTASVDLIARESDSAVSVRALQLGLGKGASDLPTTSVELIGYQIADGFSWQKARSNCLVFHNSPADASLPALPRGAVTVGLLQQKGDESVAEDSTDVVDYPLAHIAEYLEAHQVPDETVVFVLLDTFSYPVDYVESFVRKSIANANRSVVLVPVSYRRADAEFHANPTADTDISYLGMLPLGGYTARDIKASLKQFPNRQSYVVAATQLPFIVGSSAATEHSANNGLRANRLLSGCFKNSAEHDKGFVSDVCGHWQGATGAYEQVRIGRPWEGLAELERVVATPLGAPLKVDNFPVELLRVAAAIGYEASAQAYLRRYMRDSETLSRMSEADLSGVMGMCKSLGCQEDFARVFSHAAPALIKRFPNQVIPVFELFAISLPPGDLNAIVLAIAPVVLRASAKRIIFRLVDMCRKYCSTRTLFLLIGMVEQSSHKDLLTASNLPKEIGESLFAAQLDIDEFESVPNLQFYLSHAPLLPRIVDAVIRQQREDFVKLVNIYFAEQHAPQALLRGIRIYSSEISQLELRPGEIPYPVNIDRLDLLGLAILFGDSETVRKYVPAQKTGELNIVDDVGIIAASYDRHADVIQDAFARWGDAHGVTTLPFVGDSIHSLFEGFAALPALPAASTKPGRVSAIVTVYNPDIDLLRLAILSVLRQTYEDVELILVDDGSDLVEPLAIENLAAMDTRIKFLRMPKNSGPYVCRNRALEVATGAFIAIQDGDDYAHPQRFEKQVAVFAGDPLIKLCTTSHVRVDSMARFQFEHSLELRGDGTMTSMFRRDVFDALGGFAQVRSRGDVEFRERLKASYGQHRYSHLDYPLLYCFATAASLSNRTARNNPAFLSLFRDAFGKRMRVPVINGQQLCASTPVVVPHPLRPEF